MSMNPVDAAKRSRAEETFPVLAWDPETGMYIVEGNECSYAGAVLLGSPMPGADDTTTEQLKSILSSGYPAGTFIQFSLLSIPDISPWLNFYEQAHQSWNQDFYNEKQAQIVGDLCRRRIEYLHKGSKESLLSNKVLFNTQYLIISIKIPVDVIPKEEEVANAENHVIRLEEALGTIGIKSLHRMEPPEYLAFMRRIFHIYDPEYRAYDENVLLRDQILYPGDRITLNREYIKINDTYVQPISVKNYPKHASLAMMAYLIGDPGGISNQITVPWMMTTGIHFPNQRSKSAAVRNKAQTITYQAYGPLLRFIPRLAYKKHGFDVLLHSMEDGDVLVEVAFNLVLFGKSAKELEKVTSALRTYYAIHQMDVAPERYICWPVFWNTLPLFPSCESIANLSRYRTMGVRHASQLLPILGEWRGTGTGAASIFVSRRGQPILFDFYDSPTSYNGVIVAESGAGKSFLTQQFIVDYLGCGARVWVIDVGRSYEKLAGVLQGEFIEFSERSQICLNPFSLVKDIDDDTDLLRELIAKMAAPNGLDDYRLARTEEAIRAVWAHLGPTMTVTDIYEYLLGQHDDRLRDLGNMLYPWTKYGSYGQWFNGQNNLNFDNAMTVLELEELKPRKQLQQVVLLQLIARIQQEMYLSGTDQPKILIVDEAWDLLDDPGVAKFMEHGYRRFRKYNGAAIIVTQSINDLYSSVNGRAIAENSPHLLILQQRSEAIESVEHEGKIKMEPYAFRVMKELHTVKGQYSEILFHTGRGWGVGRLVVDRFTQVLYSTSGPERTEILRAIHRGVPAIEAITDFLAQNKDTEG